MDKKELVEKICVQTGMSKRDLARLIHTDHTNLTKYINGSRNLPVAAVQQLVQLHTVLNNLPPIPDPKPTAADMAALEKELVLCQEKRASLQKKYNEMLAHWQTATTLLQLAADVAQTAPLTARKQRWIEEQRYQANKLLLKNGPAAQQKMQIDIAVLQKEMELYEGEIAAFAFSTQK